MIAFIDENHVANSATYHSICIIFKLWLVFT